MANLVLTMAKSLDGFCWLPRGGRRGDTVLNMVEKLVWRCGRDSGLRSREYKTREQFERSAIVNFLAA
jgi:hypothetical protein